MSDDLIRALISFFAIIDPVGNLLIFHTLTKRLERWHRAQVAALSSATALVLLVAFSLSGETVLDYLNISSESFQIAAGILLIFPAIRLVEQGQPAPPEQMSESGHRYQVAVVPLAIPLMAGPGALATAVSFRATAGLDATIAAMAIVCAIAFLMYLLAAWLLDLLGEAVLRVLARLVGIVLMAVAVDLIVEGLDAIF